MAAIIVAACEKPIIDEYSESVVTVSDSSAVVRTKKFTFTLKGDFSDEWKSITRGYLTADGKDLTDVWVLDYMDGALVQQVHQSDNTAENFGKPVMNLAYGAHQVYFIASRGVNTVLDTDAHTITFGSVRDTFWKRYDVSVVATSNGNRAVTLDRVVTKLRLTFTDEVPASQQYFHYPAYLVLWPGLYDRTACKRTDGCSNRHHHPRCQQGTDGHTSLTVRILHG